MKQLLVTITAVPVLALIGAAQDPAQNMRADLEKMVAQAKVISINGGVMGAPVKGAPYSAVEVNETNHVLADGTRIHNESKTSVYRDSEGRVRRETPNQTTIMDPVAGVTYFLNPKTMTATKANLSIPVTFSKRTPPPPGAAAGGVMGGVISSSVGGDVSTYEFHSKDGVNTVTINGKPVDPATLKDEPKFKTDIMLHDVKPGVAVGVGGADVVFSTAPAQSWTMVGPGEAGMKIAAARATTMPGKTEALGKQTLEGVSSDGSRFTSTLETGAVGNDRPIQIVSERWFSAELQTVMMTKHSDPRTGEETFRLTNVSRGEPGADLFQVPTSYQILDRK